MQRYYHKAEFMSLLFNHRLGVVIVARAFHGRISSVL